MLHWIRTAGQSHYGATWLPRISGNRRICDLNFQKLPALLSEIRHLPIGCDHQLLSFAIVFVAQGAPVLGHRWAPTSISLHPDAEGVFLQYESLGDCLLSTGPEGPKCRSYKVVQSRMDFREVSAVEFRGVRESLLLLQRGAVFLLWDSGICPKCLESQIYGIYGLFCMSFLHHIKCK